MSVSEPLAAEVPVAWFRHVRGAIRDALLAGEDLDGSRAITMDDVVGVDHSWLTAEFRRLVGLRVPPQAAASYLAGWYAGSIAEAVGVGLAGGGAAFALLPESVRWRVHPNGWIIDVEADVEVTVADGHPWTTRADVVVASATSDVVARTVHALVETVRPIIEACRSLTKVGAIGLWNEVGDALGMALAFQAVLPADETGVALLEAAVGLDGVPWRSPPRLWFAEAERLGRVHVAQKGGCCLAHKEPIEEHDDDDLDGLDDYHRAYRERFPHPTGSAHYCATCSFRDADDCAARQVFWHQHHPAVQGGEG